MIEMARKLAERVRASGRGFLTLSKKELRSAFDVVNMTMNQASAIVDALAELEVEVFPHPYYAENTLRLYDRNHPLGKVAVAVFDPDGTTETPLKGIAEMMEREKASEDLKSDSVPWLEAFDLLLLASLGRESEAWEDPDYLRYPTLLARQLAEALGFPREWPAKPWFIYRAAALCSRRPRPARPWTAEGMVAPGAEESSLDQEFVEALADRDRNAGLEHQKVLRLAAQALLRDGPLPNGQVDLGLLGLRRRREVAD